MKYRYIFLAMWGLLFIVHFSWFWGEESYTIRFYQEDTSLFANPETGVFWWHYSSGAQAFLSPVREVANTLKEKRKEGISVIGLTYYLGEWKYTSLPQWVLDRIEDDLDVIRTIGMKAFPHFHYAYHYQYRNPMVWEETMKDAPRNIMLQHIDQLKRVWQRNADVIAVLTWGMIGPWGEQWISSNGHVGLCLQPDGSWDWSKPHRVATEYTRIIIEAMLNATPSDRMIHYAPQGIRELYGPEPLSEEEAFSGTPKSRIGIMNQCFLTDVDSSDPTYTNNYYRGPRSYLAIHGKYIPLIAFPDTGCGYSPTADELIAEIEAGHWDHIRYVRHLNADDRQRVHFKTGYRFVLRKVKIPNKVKWGDIFVMEAEIENVNSAGIYNPRKIEVIFRSPQTKEVHFFEIQGDSKGNRLFFPSGKTKKTWQLKFEIPSDLSPGSYQVCLWFPDPYPSLRYRPEYAIRLANQGLWEATTGYHDLGHVLTVEEGDNSYRLTNNLLSPFSSQVSRKNDGGCRLASAKEIKSFFGGFDGSIGFLLTIAIGILFRSKGWVLKKT